MLRMSDVNTGNTVNYGKAYEEVKSWCAPGVL